MDAQLKAQWLTALRSGEYEQGTGALRNSQEGESGTYCCLGVLCDISKRGEWRDDFYTTPGGGSAHLVPVDIANPWFGEDEYGVAITDGALPFSDRLYDRESLSALNDNGFTFLQIADIIENHF